jgi:hypothetical protein
MLNAYSEMTIGVSHIVKGAPMVRNVHQAELVHPAPIHYMDKDATNASLAYTRAKRARHNAPFAQPAIIATIK